VQVLGAAEMTYLKTLNQRRSIEIFQKRVKRGIPGLVLTRNYHPTHPMLAVAEETKLPILRPPMITMSWINLATLAIDHEFAPQGTEHATTLGIKGVGARLRGDSGVGKSAGDLPLIERGHSLVADDLTVLTLLDEREMMASSRRSIAAPWSAAASASSTSRKYSGEMSAHGTMGIKAAF